MQAEVLLHYSKLLAKCFTTCARQFQNLICQDAHCRSATAMGLRIRYRCRFMIEFAIAIATLQYGGVYRKPIRDQKFPTPKRA
jgi:hypothetical protein